MELIVKPKNIESINYIDSKFSLLLPLRDFAVDYETYFTLEEIRKIKEENKNKKIYIVINRMIYNEDIEILKEILLTLENIKITAIFFYDEAVLMLKKELNLSTELVWNSTFMVTNYKTCSYYYDKGVKYALLSNEITLNDMLIIKEKSKIEPIVMLFGYPTIATSKRPLIKNYNKINNYNDSDHLLITEKTTKTGYILIENKHATTFKKNKILNITSVLNTLVEKGFNYYLISEELLDKEIFINILEILKESLDNGEISLKDVREIKQLIGGNTGFLYRKTIYKVKKNG